MIIENSKPNERMAFFGLTLLAVFAFLWEVRIPQEQVDDAYISFQYAKNLAEGNGLVFNVGERVEGFTNLLWTLLIAFGLKIGVSAEVFCRWLSILSTSLLLIATAFLTASVLPNRAKWLSGFAPWILLASNALACWATRGLETPLYTFLVTLTFFAFIHNRRGLVLCFGILATLCRPDGALFAFILLGLDAVNKLSPDSNKPDLSIIHRFSYLAFFLLFLILYTAIRYYYYGAFLPNTFYAKTGGVPLSQGVSYFLNFLKDGTFFLIFPIIFSFFSYRKWVEIFACSTVYILYVIYVGGDVFPFHRFFLPILPVFIASAFAGCYFETNKNYKFGLILWFSLLAAPLSNLYLVDRDNYPGPVSADQFPFSVKREASRSANAFGGLEQAKAQLNKILAAVPNTKLIATVGIGQIAYLSKGIKILDLVGLVDAHIARSKKIVSGQVLILPGHQRTDSDYVVDRKPDIIIIPRKESGAALLPAIYDLWNNERFLNLYRWDQNLQAYRLAE